MYPKFVPSDVIAKAVTRMKELRANPSGPAINMLQWIAHNRTEYCQVCVGGAFYETLDPGFAKLTALTDPTNLEIPHEFVTPERCETAYGEDGVSKAMLFLDFTRRAINDDALMAVDGLRRLVAMQPHEAVAVTVSIKEWMDQQWMDSHRVEKSPVYVQAPCSDQEFDAFFAKFESYGRLLKSLNL